MKLIAAAELAVGGNRKNKRPFVWRQPILRPAKKAKQVEVLERLPWLYCLSDESCLGLSILIRGLAYIQTEGR